MIIKKGNRYLNKKGEYCIIKSVYKDVIKLQVCGKDARTEPWSKQDFVKALSYSIFEVPFPKTNRTNVGMHLLEYQLNMIGKTTADTDENPNWFNEWTIDDISYQLFKEHALKQLKKVFKFNSTKANSTFEWFYLQYGLNRE